MILSNLKKRLITSIFLLLLTVLIFNSSFIFLYTLIVMGILSVIEFNRITKKIKLIEIYYSFLIHFLLLIFLFFVQHFLFFLNIKS